MQALYRLQVMMELADRFSGPSAKIAQNLQRLQALTERVSLAQERLGAGLSTLAAGTALAAPLVLATRAAMDFEDAFADVRKVVDAPLPALRALQSQLLALTRTIPMTARELTEIAAAAGQSGIPLQEIVRFTQDAARVGVAFGISAGQAGDALAKLRNIMELSQDGVMRLADAINFLSNNMAATAPEILEVVRRVGGTGRLLGLTGQQVAAFASGLLALGTAPEVAATGLNALFQRLATAPAQPTAFQEALARLGLSATALQRALRQDAAGALMDFLRRVKAAPDQLTVLSELFGMEYADDIAKLVGSLGTLERAFGLVANPAAYTGSVLQEFQNRSATLRNALILLKNAVDRIWITLGNSLMPIVTPVVQRLTDLVNRASDLLERFPALRMAVVGVSAVLGGLLVVGGFAVTLLGAIGFASANARLGLLALRGGLESAGRQVRLFSLGLSLLRVQLAALGGPAGLARMALLGLQRASLLAGRGVFLLGRALLLNPLGLFATLLAGVGYALVQAWRHSEAFRRGIQDTFAALRAAFAPALAEFRALRDAVAGLFRPLGDAVQASLGVIPQVLDRVLYGVFYGLGFFVGLIQGLALRLAPIFGEGLAGLVRLVRGFVDLVVGLFTLDLDRARQGALRVWEGLQAVFAVPFKLGGVVWDLLRSGLFAALSFARGLVGPFVEAGKAIVQGLTQGIVSLAMAPVNAVRQLGGKAITALRNLLGIRSPSRVFAEIGAMTALGMAVGLQGAAPEVARAVQALMPPAPQLELPAVRPAVQVPELPSLDALVPPSPVAAAPGQAPERGNGRKGEGRVVQVVRIERLELPGVRDADEFLQALKRLMVPYLEEA
ncbi:phage tail tape measure protein [Thermus sp. SYSU G05001]|uniref:Phage tail tape measure protein n=1 Tax=Thermus brevis TaxID=2862456 RepID=A0ABS6ZZ11_9DEIN|nr:phage tail tape measure protein [Thermus brevis]